jgi:hypothetical protein
VPWEEFASLGPPRSGFAMRHVPITKMFVRALNPGLEIRHSLPGSRFFLVLSDG